MRKKRLLHGLWFNLQAHPTELFQKTNPCKITDGPQQLGRKYTVKLEEYLRKRKKEDGVSQPPMTKVTGLCLPCGQPASFDAFRIELSA